MTYRTACGPKIECFACRDIVSATEGRTLGPPFLDADKDFCVDCYMKRLRRELKSVSDFSRGYW